jgi:tyrosine-protein phosphatase SIW14
MPVPGRVSRRSVELLLLLSLFLLCGCAVPGFNPQGIPNFATVAPGIYRGGQPIYEESWLYLSSLGVSNVLKLNLEKEANDDAAQRHGMTVHYTGISMEQQLFPMPLFQRPVPELHDVLTQIKPGTFVHCAHGQDRTGLAIACYRLQEQGWTRIEAQHEMLDNGFHRELRGLWHYWKHFQR